MKKWIDYIKFFWYFASNWNPGLAFFMLRQEVKGENKYGLNTSNPIDLKHLTIENGDLSKASRYEGVNFFILEALLQKLKELTSKTCFTDLGCGKGRAMVVAAHYGYIKIRGIDFAKEVCEAATLNMQTIEAKFPAIEYEVVCDNVLNYVIQPDESIFFMFNPFDNEIIHSFLEKIEGSLKQHSRTIYFLYVSPKHIETFFEFEYEPVYRKRKLKWLDGVILKKEA
ncbi:MAG: class I SAM-dependent methyltransferase [Agriterribacter sp.]